MIKKYGIWLIAAIFTLQSCSVNTETTYYNDSATIMESNILMDQSVLGMMNMMGKGTGTFKDSKELANLTTDWKSLYDIQKNGKITVHQDSAKVLKKMFIKLNKDKGELYGLSLKYDKLLPKEITSLLSQNKQLKNLPLQNVGTWNGKTLTIDTDKFNNTEFLAEMAKETPNSTTTKPNSKSDSLEVYGKQMAQGMIGMMKMFNVNYSSKIKFQKPIKSIVGKHDFVKQIDNKTLQISLRSNDLLDGGKGLTNKDKKLIITTE
ncbi:hypothetical protein [Chryseobacterium sp. MP_3.2]|uniref:hypothetical protein n=1 Tax=Chryseobacterium sp. MP_3.2 TaxID=3071712 RepID=UPI002DFA456F|nr:hypothetical protein [Chryseobacterium sp. MP_3.2]